MNTDDFWGIIHQSRDQSEGDPYVQFELVAEALEALSAEEVAEFDRELVITMDRAYSWDHISASRLAGCDPTMDGFRDFRAWLVSHGRQVFEDALQDVEVLAGVPSRYDLLPDVPDKWEFNALRLTPNDIYEEKTGQDLPPHEDPKQLLGTPCDCSLESLMRRFPQLWKRFGHEWQQGQLVAAIEQNDVAEIQRLIAAGQDVDEVDNAGNQPLHHAVPNDNTEIVKLLLAAGADVNGKGFEEDAPIMRSRSIEMGQLLIDNGADLAAVDRNGMTPLMHACNLDVTQLVQLLIELGVDVNARSNVGATALIYGVYARTMSEESPRKGDIIDLLLQAGADINAKDNNDMTALKISQQPGCGSQGGSSYVEYLIEQGAE